MIIELTVVPRRLATDAHSGVLQIVIEYQFTRLKIISDEWVYILQIVIEYHHVGSTALFLDEWVYILVFSDICVGYVRDCMSSMDWVVKLQYLGKRLVRGI